MSFIVNAYRYASAFTDNVSVLLDGVAEAFAGDGLMTAASSDTVGTISFWIRTSDTTPAATENPITFGETSGSAFLFVQLKTDGKLEGIARNSAASGRWTYRTTAAPFTNDTWHHVVIVQNGTIPVFYVDGAAPALTAALSIDATWWLGSAGASMDNFRVGCRNFNSAGNANFFSGYLNDIAYFSTNLTSGEVTELYAGGCPYDVTTHSQAASLRSFYTFDGGSDSEVTVYDQHGSADLTGSNVDSGDLQSETPC